MPVPGKRSLVVRNVALLCALLVLVTLVVWALGPFGGDAATVQAGQRAIRRPPRAELDLSAAAVRGDGADVQRGEAQQHSAAPDAPIEPRAHVERLEVRALAVPARKPVAEARLRVWNPAGLSSAKQRELWENAVESNQLDQLLSQCSMESRADRDGRAELELAAGGWVVADAEGLFGVECCMPGRSAPLVVELHRDFALAARVVDAAGTPKPGVCVGLRVHQWGDAFDLATAVSDEKGLVRIDHAGWRLSEYGLLGGPRLTLAVTGPLQPSVEHEFDWLAPPVEPVELRLADCGEVEVAVFDVDGRPASAKATVALHFIERLGPGEDEFDWLHPGASTPLRDGVALFPCVSLAREFTAVASYEGSGQNQIKTGRSPLRVGERTRIEVRFADVRALTALLVDATGAPLSERHVEVLAETPAKPDPDWIASTRSELDGRIRVPSIGASTQRVVFVVTDELDRERGVARASLQGPSGAQALDLGELVVTPMPLLASGRVVDATGRALGGAMVRARTGVVDDDDAARTQWRDFRWNTTRADDAGYFELRSEFRGTRLALEATWGEARSAPLEVRPGERDLELVVEPTGAVSGVLRLDSSMKSAALQVFAEPRQLARTRGPMLERWHSSPVDLNGAFAFAGLDPGIYDVYVQLEEGSWNELARVENVVVRAGEPSEDPRLNPLVIAERSITLRISDESGAPVSSGDCLARFHHTPPDEYEYLGFEQGRLRVAATVFPVDLSIAAEGYFFQRLGPVAADREVVLQRAPLVRIAARPALGAVGPKADFYLVVSPPQASESYGEDAWLSLSPDGSATGHVPFVGEARLSVHAHWESTAGWRSMEIELLEPRAITIGAASAGEQLFSVQIDRDSLAKALEEIGR